MANGNHCSNYYFRKKYWLINAVLSGLLRTSALLRDKNIWVFGAWEGERFDDNSRYLFEYVVNKKNTIHAFWITRNNNVIRILNEKKLPVLHCDSKEGRRIMLKAGVAFYTNGLDDFSRICYLYGATIIHLGHAAAAIKKTGSNINSYHNSFTKMFLKKIKDNIFSWYHFKYVIATSEESAKSKMETYHVKRKKVILTGMPRNDLLLCKKSIMDVNGFRYILYLPTYRLYDNDVVKDLVNMIQHDDVLNWLLTENKYKLLIKLHNADLLNSNIVINSSNIVLLNNEVTLSTQELLVASDILITDYSSCSIDFALTMKPIILYAPDYIQYNQDNGIIDLWDDLYKSEIVVKDLDTLKNRIIRLLTETELDSSLNNKINSVYQDESIAGTSFSENVYQRICNEIGIGGYHDEKGLQN